MNSFIDVAAHRKGRGLTETRLCPTARSYRRTKFLGGIMPKTEKLFIVEVGEYFSIMISGPVTSCADPAGIIDSKTYEFQATEGGLLNYGRKV